MPQANAPVTRLDHRVFILDAAGGGNLFALDLTLRPCTLIWTKFNSPGKVGEGSTLSRLSPRQLFLVGGIHSKMATIFDVELNQWKTEFEIPREIQVESVEGVEGVEDKFFEEGLFDHRAVEMDTEKGIAVFCFGGQVDLINLSKNVIIFDVTF